MHCWNRKVEEIFSRIFHHVNSFFWVVYATATKNAAAASFAKAARIRLPKLLRLGARDFPKIYANLSLNCVDFLFGAFGLLNCYFSFD